MNFKTLIMIRLSVFLVIITFIFSSFIALERNVISDINLVQSSAWFIAGPVKESQKEINIIRQKEGIIRVVAQDNPKGEIELNVMITPSESNDGIPTAISSNSKFVTIVYKSTQLIKLQAREGNEARTGCVHGGSHPRVDLPASCNKFTTIQIPWSNFKQDGLPDGKLLNIHNLCKFNFVNYCPISGALLEIKSVTLKI